MDGSRIMVGSSSPPHAPPAANIPDSLMAKTQGTDINLPVWDAQIQIPNLPGSDLYHTLIRVLGSRYLTIRSLEHRYYCHELLDFIHDS